MKRYVLVLLLALLATAASAQQAIQSSPAPDGTKGAVVNITSSTPAGVYYVSPAAANNVIEFDRGAAIVGTLYHCITTAADTNRDGVVDTAARCVVITTLSADTIVTVTNPSRYFVIDIDTPESAGNTSFLTIRGSLSAGVPSLSGPNNLTSASTERQGGTLGVQALPAATVFGHGLSMEGTPGFTAARYPGGPAGQGSEPNNMMGWFYNKTGILPSGISAIVNLFETAWDFSWELAYRAGFTGDETWVELNWDIWAPDFITTTTGGAAGAFFAGDRASCSGGGSLYVVAYPSANNLTFRQDYGQCLAGEVVTNQTAPRVGNTATLGTLTANHTTTGYFRPFIAVYRTLQNTASFTFDTSPGGADTFNISAGYARMNGNIMVSGTGSTVYGPAYWAISDGGANDTGTEICSQNGAGVFACQSVINFGALGVSPTSVACGTSITSTHTFIAMCR